MPNILASILASVAAKLLTEKFLIKLTLFTLEKVAARTSTKIDDEVVAMVKEALNE